MEFRVRGVTLDVFLANKIAFVAAIASTMGVDASDVSGGGH